VQLAIVLPTYNERGNVIPLLERLERAFLGLAYELIFIDDTADGTDIEIAEQARACPRIVLTHRQVRTGLATAVIDGVEGARKDACVLDADLQHPPKLPRLASSRLRPACGVPAEPRGVSVRSIPQYCRRPCTHESNGPLLHR
jgi:dolichol-phosphate mannosyltransferase